MSRRPRHSIYRAEITAWDRNTSTEIVLRYSTRGYVTGASDSPADTYYDARIVQPVDVARNIVGFGQTYGRSVFTPGELVLDNKDGGLDDLLNRYALDGREVRIYRAEVAHPWRTHVSPDEFAPIFFGTTDIPEFTLEVIRVPLRDRGYDLKVALQSTKYAGTNALPAGVEGTANDLQGKPKPWCVGVVKQIDPPCVNTTRFIYQVHDGEVTSIDAVRVKGKALSAGTAHATQAAMEAATPASGTFDTWLNGGMFRLNSADMVGLVTADVTEGTAATRTAAQIFLTLISRAEEVNEWVDLGQVDLITSTGDTLVTSAGDTLIASESVRQTDLTALDAEDDAELGYWTKHETTIAAVCDQVCGTVGAWWGVDRNGVFRVKRLKAPRLDDDYLFRIVESDLVRPLERLATYDPGKGVPAYRQVVQWGRHYATQESDIDSSVSQAMREQLRAEWREVVAEDETIQQVHLRAPEVRRPSLYSAAADASDEAARRLGLYRLRRDLLVLTIPLTAETEVAELGDVVRLSHSRYGLDIEAGPTGDETDVGLPFVVLGVEPNAARAEISLTVWGGSASVQNLVTDDGDYLITSTGDYLLAQAA